MFTSFEWFSRRGRAAEGWMKGVSTRIALLQIGISRNFLISLYCAYEPQQPERYS